MKILLTAFDAFGADALNPTEQILPNLAELFADTDVVLTTCVLPTSFSRAFPCVKNYLAKENFDAVLSLGVAAGRNAIDLERVAINCIDARIPDNDGVQPIDVPVCKDGLNAYFTTIPIRRIAESLKESEPPIRISNSAGTYVCNQLFYSLLHYAATKRPRLRVGFIHIPCATEQGKGETFYSAPLQDIRDAVASILLELTNILRREKEAIKAETERKKILASFMPNGYCEIMPAKLKKRMVIYEEIFKLFESGKQYSEKEVNAIISQIHGDYCTVRRMFVSMGWMTRSNGIYTALNSPPDTNTP